jgi:hypothetical protein
VHPNLFSVDHHNLCVLAGESGHDVVKTDLGRAVHQYLKGFEWTLEVQLAQVRSALSALC